MFLLCYRTDSVVSMSALVAVLKTVARCHFKTTHSTAVEEPSQVDFVSPPCVLPVTASENRLKGADVTPVHSSSRLGHLSVISGVVQFVLPRIPNHVSVLCRKEGGREEGLYEWVWSMHVCMYLGHPLCHLCPCLVWYREYHYHPSSHVVLWTSLT